MEGKLTNKIGIFDTISKKFKKELNQVKNRVGNEQEKKKPEMKTRLKQYT